MLVLSRRPSDTIRLPDLGITIEVLNVKGSSVRLGVDAPIEIKVLRGEVEDKQKLSKQLIIADQSEHAVRNKLNSLKIAVAVAQKHIQQQRHEQAANILDKAIRKIEIAASQNSVEVPSVIDPELNRGIEVKEHSDNNAVSALLVEDSENERTMLAGLLRLHGYEVNSASDGLEALAFLESNQKPNFILMDMCMPNLDGASAIRQIRKSPIFDAVEIYAVSGQTPREAGIDVTSNRIANWFRKPIEPKKLLGEISQNFEPARN